MASDDSGSNEGWRVDTVDITWCQGQGPPYTDAHGDVFSKSDANPDRYSLGDNFDGNPVLAPAVAMPTSP